MSIGFSKLFSCAFLHYILRRQIFVLKIFPMPNPFSAPKGRLYLSIVLFRATPHTLSLQKIKKPMKHLSMNHRLSSGLRNPSPFFPTSYLTDFYFTIVIVSVVTFPKSSSNLNSKTFSPSTKVNSTTCSSLNPFTAPISVS